MMDERPTIVVGVDGSPDARAAVGYALDDAVRRGAKVRAVCAVEEPQYWAVAYGMSAPAPMPEMAAATEKAAQQMVDEVRAEHPGSADVPLDVRAVVGPAASVLIEQARDADLLVLGHRGRGALASAVLGSVGLQCVMHAPGSVTIVRAETSGAS